MLSWFQAIMPKEDAFFALFSRHAEILVKGAEALRDLLEGGDRVPEACRRIVEHENAADDVAREAMLLMRRTLITPFDRSDIKELVSSLDDAIDQMQKTAKATNLFEMTEFDPHMREIGDLIVRAANVTVETVVLLKGMNRHASRLNSLTEDVTRLEELADHTFDAGMKALFLKHRTADPMGFIAGSEIYDHLEKVMDRFEDVANRISGIVIEHS